VPVYGSDGSLCPGGNAGLTVLVNRPNAPEPRVCLTRTEGNLPVLETITRFADSKLNGSIEELVSDKDESGNSRPAWLAVTKYQGQFMDRGFCASKVREYSNNTAPEEPFAGCKSASDTAHLVSGLSLSGRATQETLHLPVVSTNGPEWRPFDPVVDYRPYHHRSRLLRTMNETYFLVNQLARGSQQSKASGLLSLRTTAVSGAFHPTAEAHSIFADEFLVESEGILQRPLM
jgi:hypothetical protein